MHTLAFLEPAHFHAALTLGQPEPRVRDEIFVYARPGPELDDFLALVEAFNRRSERPTGWRPVVRAGEQSMERLLAERPGDVAILAGRNDVKMARMRALHDAGIHVLADKPWLAGSKGLEDLRHVLSGGALCMEIMTGRHDVGSILTRKLVADADVFGAWEGDPAIEIASVHHLEKLVNGRPLRRPAWFFDVRAQGDGLADIPTHMVDQAQRLVIAAARQPADTSSALALVRSRRWATRVPLELFARVTGAPHFPDDLGGAVDGAELSYEGNAEIALRVAGVSAVLRTQWDLSVPAGGGDAHRTVLRGSRAQIRVEQDASTGFRRRLAVLPRIDAVSRSLHTLSVRAAVERVVASWQAEHPGVRVSEAGESLEIIVPPGLDAGHESHFPLVLADFLDQVERGVHGRGRSADTLAKYVLLAQASAEARPGQRSASGGV